MIQTNNSINSNTANTHTNYQARPIVRTNESKPRQLTIPQTPEFVRR